MTRIPIACELTADDADLRVEEWRQFLATQVIEVRQGARSIRLSLRDDDAVLAAVDLARREKTCCPFFQFRLVPLPETVWLDIEVPDEAAKFSTHSST